MHLNGFHSLLRQVLKCCNNAIFLLKLSICAIFLLFFMTQVSKSYKWPHIFLFPSGFVFLWLPILGRFAVSPLAIQFWSLLPKILPQSARNQKCDKNPLKSAKKRTQKEQKKKSKVLVLIYAESLNYKSGLGFFVPVLKVPSFEVPTWALLSKMATFWGQKIALPVLVHKF